MKIEITGVKELKISQKEQKVEGEIIVNYSDKDSDGAGVMSIEDFPEDLQSWIWCTLKNIEDVINDAYKKAEKSV